MSNQFFGDLNRGKPGEAIAERWLRGIDFENLPQHVQISRDYRPLFDVQTWQSIPGENKNRDWLVMDTRTSDAPFMRLEVKTDFRAHVDIADRYHTGNITVEVDSNCIANLDEVIQRRDKGAKRYAADETAWFNVAEGGHADWYAFYLPLANRDTAGNVISQSGMHEHRLSPEHVQRFMRDSNIEAGDSIAVAVPFEYILLIRWDKLKELLEQHCGIKFQNAAPGQKGKALFILPLKLLTDELKPSKRAEHDGRMALIPVCELATKGESAYPWEGRIFMPHSLNAALKEAMVLRGEEIPHDTINNWSIQISALEPNTCLKLNCDGLIVTIEGQRSDIRAYQTGRREFQPFNTVIAAEHLYSYPL